MSRTPHTQTTRRPRAGAPRSGVLCPLAVAAALAAGVAPRPARGDRATTRPAAAADRAIEELRGSDWILQYRAIRQLARRPTPRAKAALRGVLTGGGHPWLRGRALVALAEASGAEMLGEALTFARAGSVELRAAAVEALGVIASPAGDAAAAAALRDTAPEVRCQAVLALARLRKAKAWPLIQPLLKGSDVRLLRQAVRALPFVATDAARRAVAGLLEHDDAAVRLEAVRALGRFGSADDIGRLLVRMTRDADGTTRRAAEKVLASYPAAVRQRHMLAALRSGEADFHRAALAILARTPDRASCDAVAALVRDADLGVKYRGVYSEVLSLLAAGEPDRYADVFRRFLGQSSSSVRRVAVRCLARCRRVDHFAVLRPLLSDRSSTIRSQVLDSLDEATHAAPPGGIVTYLVPALAGDSWDTRKKAVALLARRATPAELPRALAAVGRDLGGSDGAKRAYLAKALAAVGGDDARRQIAAAQGCVTDWTVIGPFPNDKLNRGFEAVYPPEIDADPAKPCPAFGLGKGAVFEASAGGDGRRECLRIAPPAAGGKTVVTYMLTVPADANARLAASLSAGAGQERPGGVKLAVRADGKDLLARALSPDDRERSVAVALGGFAGRKMQLVLLAETLDDANNGVAVLTRPRLIGGGRTIGLVRLAATATARSVRRGAREKSLAWHPYRVAAASGVVPFHDIFPPPTRYNVAYAATDVRAAADRNVFLEIDADDACAVWLNGKCVCREGEACRARRVPVTLRRGPNRLLVKVANLVEWWHVRVRITDERGRRASTASPQP